MATQNPHLTEEQLAALLEGGLGGLEKTNLENHLLQCRVCMAAYGDTIRMRDDWVRSTGLRGGDAEMKELGYGRFPGAMQPLKGEGLPVQPRFVAPPVTADGGRGQSRKWLVAAVVPLLVVGLGWFAMRGPLFDKAVYPSLELVTAAVDQASHHGMILPGSGAATWSPSTTFRAVGETRPDLDAALADLAFDPDDNAARLLRTEGLLATGSLDLARLITENARRVLPNDTSWQQLAAVVAFRENNLARAEILLRGVLVVEPQNIEALFNLAMVLTAGNQLPEAREAFGIVALRDEFPLAQRRAEVELARLGG
jgi:tetratricopeptide (TPR) repeat protein